MPEKVKDLGGELSTVIRPRFAPDVADRLMVLSWWDWDHDRLGAALDDFRELSAEAFLERHE